MSFNSLFEKDGFEALIDHRESVPVGTPVEEVYVRFRRQPIDSMAIVRDGKYEATVFRNDTISLLSGRYGFPLFAQRSVEEYLSAEQLVITEDLPLRDVLEEALTRRSKEYFHRDVVLLGEGKEYRGMIPAHSLIKLQWELMNEGAEQIQAQRSVLEERNREMLDNLSKLRESRGRWHSIFERSPLAIAIADEDGTIEARNPALADLVPVGDESVDNIADFVPSDQRAALLEAMNGSCSWGKSTGREFWLRDDWCSRPTLVRTIFACIPETRQVAVILDDITAEREFDTMLLESEKSKALDNLVGGVAHELNNKLSPLLGYLSLSHSEERTDIDLYDLAPAMKEAAEDAATIIRQLLDLSRPPALERSNGDLREVVQTTLEFLSVEARRRDIQLELCDENREATFSLSHDSGQIRQVVLNLLLNAFDAVENLEDRRVAVSLENDGNYALVSVVDNGPGIDDEIRERIFSPFFTTKQGTHGSGLGLSVCRKIAHLHEGEIEFEKGESGGSRFTLRLPFTSRDRAPTQPILPTARHRRVSDCENLSALVVEDEPFVAAFLQKALKAELGLHSIIAENGERATEQLASQSFDLIVSDVRMPAMDGFALWRWIRDNRPELRDRFIFVTGDAGGSAFEEKLQKLNTPVLRKPFAIDDLSQTCYGVIMAR